MYKQKTDSILTAFKAINDSLLASNERVTDKNDALYGSFGDKAKNEELFKAIRADNTIPTAQKQLADSLVAAYNATATFIEETRHKLELADDSGADAVNRIMTYEKNGVKLYHLLHRFSKLAIACSKDADAVKRLKEIFASLYDAASAQDFVETHFNDVPDMAAITMLNKFDSDCRNAQMIALQQLSKARWQASVQP